MSRLNDEQWWQQLDAGLRQQVPPDKQVLFTAMLRDLIKSPEEIQFWVQRLFTDQLIHAEQDRVVVCKAGNAFYQAAIEALNQHGEDFDYFLDHIRDQTGLDGKYLDMPLRIAFTGVLHGPDLRVIFKLLGPEQARIRLVQVLDLCHCY